VLGHDLGNDLVLAFELAFQSRYGLLGFAYRTGVGLLGKRRSSILKEGFLPLVKQRGVDPFLLADLGDGLTLQQVPAQDFDFFFGAVVPSNVLMFVIHALFLFKEK
jgi:hypothetical protein